MRKGLFSFFSWFAAIFLSFSLKAQTHEQGPRLAIVAETRSAEIAVDLLTAVLSKHPALQLLERTEIDRIYREQTLSVANRDILKLGQLLGADGVLFVRASEEGTNRLLQAQLVAVKPGVVIGDLRRSWPEAGISDWASLVARDFEPLYSKLGVLAKDAIPVSVLNLRSALKSDAEQEMERQLTLLLIARLTHERELFVLERRRMNALGDEKDLKTPAESKFWNGSYLVEGTLDRDGYSKDRATIDIRLTPPDGPPLDIGVSGNRLDLPNLVEDLARKILKSLRHVSTSETWKPSDEAFRYYEEAKWALRWGMNREALAAADSAWALGKRDLDCAMMRVKACMAGASLPEYNELFDGGHWRDETGRTNSINEEISELTEEHKPAPVLFSRENSDALSFLFFKKAPDSNKMLNAVRALEFFSEQLKSLPSAKAQQQKEWGTTGAALLSLAGGWLRIYYLQTGARAGLEAKLEEARRLAVELTTTLGIMPQAIGKDFWGALGNFGVFWCETPEEGIALYRKVFAARQYEFVREHILKNRLEWPMLTAWHGNDRERIAGFWNGLLQDLSSSPDRELRANGLFLICADSHDLELFGAAFEKLLKSLYGEKSMVWDIDNLFSNRLMEHFSPKWKQFQSRRWDPISGFERSLSEAIDWSPLQPRISATTNRPNSIGRSTPANQVITKASLSNRSPIQKGSRMSSAPAPKPPSLVPVHSAKQIEHIQDWTPVLTKELHRLLCPADKSSEPVKGTILSFCFREAFLWVETQFVWYASIGSGSQLTERRVFYRLNLKDFSSEAIIVENDDYSPKEVDPFAGYHATFDVFDGWLYVSSVNRIKRYSILEKRWETLSAPVGGRCRICAFNGRIYASSATTLLEMSPDGRTSRILASNRRVPPVTILDELDDFAGPVPGGMTWHKIYPVILPGPNGSIMAFLKGKLYMLPRDSNIWGLVADIPESHEAKTTYSNAALLIYSAPTVYAEKPGWSSPSPNSCYCTPVRRIWNVCLLTVPALTPSTLCIRRALSQNRKLHGWWRPKSFISLVHWLASMVIHCGWFLIPSL